MKRKKPRQDLVDVRAILESPVGRARDGGPPICAYEAGLRRSAEKAANGNMSQARRFIRELESHGLLRIPEAVDDHEYLIRIPNEWDHHAWNAMFDHYGPPPWPGDHDGLISKERWEANYGSRPRPVGRRSARRR